MSEVVNQMGATQTKVDFGIVEALQKKDKDKIVSMSGDVLFKDINTFIPELILNIGLFVFGVLGIVLMRLLSQGWLNDSIRPQVSPASFDLIVGHVMFIQTALIIGIAIPILISCLLFVFKWYFFYPRGKKQIVARAWKANIVRFGVEEIKDNYLKFDSKKEGADELHINYGAAAIDYNTGRKVVLVQEGLSENTPWHTNIATNEKVKDRGNVNASMFSAALKFADMQNKKAQGFFANPQNWVLLIILALVIVAVFFMVTKGSPTTALTDMAASMTTRSG